MIAMRRTKSLTATEGLMSWVTVLSHGSATVQIMPHTVVAQFPVLAGERNRYMQALRSEETAGIEPVFTAFCRSERHTATSAQKVAVCR
jgi:hypothetical protein